MNHPHTESIHSDNDTPSGLAADKSLSPNPEKAQKRISEISADAKADRPRTRSQTSSLPSSRRTDDAVLALKTSYKRTRDIDSDKKSPKRGKDRANTKSYDESPALSSSETPSPSDLHTPPPEQATGVTPSAQYTFLDTCTLPLSDRRGPRARAAPPIPVPNLTKKSRGRRVPTKLPAVDPAVTNNVDTSTHIGTNRVYVCKVENCGKCFNRGEHLKRHIRSIHTYEKPFQCTHAGCEKFFNRHDNLLQHLKVHKAQQPSSASTGASPDPNDHVSTADITGPPIHLKTHFGQTASLRSGADRINIVVPPRFRDRSPDSFATNMAVSSLRTEIPHSPDDARPPTNSPTRLRYTHHIDTSYDAPLHANPTDTDITYNGPFPAH